MKKLISLLLVTIICVSLVACKEVSSLVLSTNQCEITIGETYFLQYTILPEDAKNKSISWSSSNPSIAKVDNGKITAISVGQTNIMVSSSNGTSAVCSVSVKEKSAYDRLSKEEREFVDKVLENLYQFNNPDSVSIKAIQKYSDSKWLVAVTAQNGFGGSTSALYELDYKFSKSYASTIIHNGFDLKLINEAIDEKR